MSAYQNWIEFTGRDGSKITQLVEGIETIIEHEVPVKGSPGETRKEVYLLLKNQNKLSVVGVTRKDIFDRIRACTGLIISLIEEPAEPV